MTIQPAKVSPTKLAYKLQPMSVSWSVQMNSKRFWPASAVC